MANSKVDALLDAAEAEFASAGTESGSLRMIMREAGADPAAVHHHFGGRPALAERCSSASWPAERGTTRTAFWGGGQRPAVGVTARRGFDPPPREGGARANGDVAWRIRWCVFGTLGALLTDESAPFEQTPNDLITNSYVPSPPRSPHDRNREVSLAEESQPS
jgi:AcrR family transcriptional regulator